MAHRQSLISGLSAKEITPRLPGAILLLKIHSSPNRREMLLSSFITPILSFQNKLRLKTSSPGHSHPANRNAEDHVGEHHLVTNATIVPPVKTTRGRKTNTKLLIAACHVQFIFCIIFFFYLFVLGEVSL